MYLSQSYKAKALKTEKVLFITRRFWFVIRRIRADQPVFFRLLWKEDQPVFSSEESCWTKTSGDQQFSFFFYLFLCLFTLFWLFIVPALFVLRSPLQFQIASNDICNFRVGTELNTFKVKFDQKLLMFYNRNNNNNKKVF